jgi:thioredoxin reductase
VIDAGAPRNAAAAHMQGFLTRDGLPPDELLVLGRQEIEGYGVAILRGSAGEIAHAGPSGFRVVLADGRSVSTRRLLVATGLRDEIPDIPGLRARWARDVLHCPYCHGYEVRDRKLAVLGGSPGAIRYAQIVRQWSDDLVYITPVGRLTAVERQELSARGIVIAEGDAQRIVVEHDRLSGVDLDGNRTVSCEALFVPPRFVPNSDLLVGIGCELDGSGWPVADVEGRTSVAGVWVAGNVTDARAQVITAAGEGSAAAIAINADLVDEDVRDAVLAAAGPQLTTETTHSQETTR